MKNNTVLVIACAAAVVFAVLYATSYYTTVKNLVGINLGGGASQIETFVKDFRAGFTIGTNGTEIDNYKCASASWNVALESGAGALSPGASVSTTIGLTGVVAGDVVQASLNSVTSTRLWKVLANVQGAGTTTINFISIASTTQSFATITTSTAKVCYWH